VLLADLIVGSPANPLAGSVANVAHVGKAIAWSTDEPAKRMKDQATAVAAWRGMVNLVINIFHFLPSDSPRNIERRTE
jgi:hypothetical protein